jgi:hypothetical protein
VLSRLLTMTRTAKRGISNAAAMAACAVCLVAAAAIVRVSVLARAHRQAGQPQPFHAPIDRVSSDAAWDAARVSDVAVADVFSQRSRADFAADAARDRLVDVRSHRQANVVPGPVRRMAMPRMRVAHTGSHAAAIPVVGAEWHGSVTFTRLVQSVDALGRRLPVEPVVRSHVHPTSLSAHGEFTAPDAGCLRGHAAQLAAAACTSEPDSARRPSPSPEKWTPEVSDHICFHFRGLSTYCVST